MKGLILNHNPGNLAGRIRGEAVQNSIQWSEIPPETSARMDFDALVRFCRDAGFDLIVGGGNEDEKLLLGRLSARLSIPIFTECLEMEISREMRLYRADRSGEKLGVFVGTPPCIVSFSSTAPLRETGDSSSEDFFRENFSGLSGDAIQKLLSDPKITILSREPLLAKATGNIVVCVGRGAGERGVKLAKTFAGRIGAEIGCTRAVVEDGLMDREDQIGQSGKSVSPGLYLGFGVSGAFQHLVGMSSSRRIISVNVNPNAPVLSVSETGKIADAREVLRILVEKTKDGEKQV